MFKFIISYKVKFLIWESFESLEFSNVLLAINVYEEMKTYPIYEKLKLKGIFIGN